MKTEIIIVKYNQPEFEAGTIQAVVQNTTDCRYSLTAHQNEKGIGLAKCWNRLIEATDADMICLLNSDTVPARRWLWLLLSTFTDKEIGAVMPSSNNCAVGAIPVPPAVDGIYLRAVNDFATGLADQMDEKVEDVDVGSATCLVFPKKVWELAGKFDEDFFLYGEDSEFTWRIKNKLGLRLLWRKAAYVHHFKAKSVQKAVADGELNYEQARKEATLLWRLKTGKDPKTGKQLTNA